MNIDILEENLQKIQELEAEIEAEKQARIKNLPKFKEKLAELQKEKDVGPSDS